MKESLEKAVQSLTSACKDLGEVLHKSNNVEGLIVMPLIGRAYEIRRDLENLLSARNGDQLREPTKKA